MSRPGYRLLQVVECGVPLFLVKANVLLIEWKPLGPVEEFVMHAISRGFTVVNEISGILGINPDMVTSVLVDLQREDLVKQAVENSHRVMRLTVHGSAVLDKHLRESPSREQIKITFDRLLWEVVTSIHSDLLKPADMERTGRLELKPKKNSRVKIQDLNLEAIDREVHSLRSRSVKPTVLAVESIERHEKFFLPAELAIFESRDGGEPQTSVLIDGRISEHHEAMLELLGGLDFLESQVRAPAPSPLRTLTEDYGSEVAQALASEAPTPVDRQEERLARIASAFGAIEGHEDEATPTVIHPATAFATRDVEYIDTFEHQEYLKSALTSSTSRLVIVSPWIAAKVVNQIFLDQLETLLRKGVRVHIGYGLRQRPGDRAKLKSDEVAEEKLKALASRFKTFVLKDLGNTHSKQLLFDDTHISGSFNWLSFQGNKNMEYRHEESTVIRKKTIVDAKYIDLCARIEGELVPRSILPRPVIKSRRIPPPPESN